MANPWLNTGYAETANVNIPNGATTTLVTLPGVTTSTPNDPVYMDFAATITAGTGTTALVVTIARAGGGPTVKQRTIPVTAGSTVGVGIQARDFPGLVDGQQYVVTVNPTGATAAGTAIDAACNIVN